MKTKTTAAALLLAALLLLASCGESEMGKESGTDSQSSAVTAARTDPADTTAGETEQEADSTGEETDGGDDTAAVSDPEDTGKGDETKKEPSAADTTAKDTEKSSEESQSTGDTEDTEPQGPVLLKWEEFYALSSTEKDAYLESFGDPEKFYDWMVAAQAQFKVDYPEIEIGPDGVIDLSKLRK